MSCDPVLAVWTAVPPDPGAGTSLEGEGKGHERVEVGFRLLNAPSSKL